MRRRVLIVTHGNDDHAIRVRGALDRSGAEPIWFDTDAYGAGSDIDFQIAGDVADVQTLIAPEPEADAPRAIVSLARQGA